VNKTRPKVNIVPPQCEELTKSQPAHEPEDDQRRETFGLGSDQDPSDLSRRERAWLRTGNPRSLDKRCDVTAYQTQRSAMGRPRRNTA
jgi:hypothetical protein